MARQNTGRTLSSLLLVSRSIEVLHKYGFLSPGTLMILKSACSNNPSYIDRLISVFMRSLQKMVREHLNPQATAGAAEANTGIALIDYLLILEQQFVKLPW